MADSDGHGHVGALQVLLVWAAGQTSSGIFSILHILVKPFHIQRDPGRQFLWNSSSSSLVVFFLFFGASPAHLNCCLSLESLLSFLEDSLASNYENVDTHLSTGLVHTFFQFCTAASWGLVGISSPSKFIKMALCGRWALLRPIRFSPQNWELLHPSLGNTERIRFAVCLWLTQTWGSHWNM